MGLLSSFRKSRGTEPSGNSVRPIINVDSIRPELERRIAKLLDLAYPLDRFCEGSYETQGLSEAQRDLFYKMDNWVGGAVDAKRKGYLDASNRLYLMAAASDEVLTIGHIWGWFKVLLLAKNFQDAQLLLRYYHALSACRTHHETNRGNLKPTIPESLISLKFNPCRVFEDATFTDPRDRYSVEEKIAAFGGSEYWRSYSLSKSEYQDFSKYFAIDKEV